MAKRRKIQLKKESHRIYLCQKEKKQVHRGRKERNLKRRKKD